MRTALVSGAEARRLFVLAWPLVVAQLGWITLGLVDSLMLGRVSTQVLAAGVLGHTWSFSLLVFGRGTVFGLDPLVTQAHGAEDRHAFDRALAHGAVLAALLAMPITALHLVAAPVLTWLGQPEALVPFASEYAAVVGLSVLPTLLELVLRQGLQARERMMPSMWVALVGNVLNVPLNLVLIWGAGSWDGLGAIGAAWATTAVRIAMFLAILVFAHQDARALLRGLVQVRWARLRAVAALSTPIGLQQALEVGGFSLATIIVGWQGEDAVAAHTVALNLSATAFMVPLGISGAAATRVGNLIGAGQPWTTAAGTALLVGAGVMLGSATVFLTVPELLAGFWLGEAPEVLALAGRLLSVAAAFSVFDGCQVVGFGVLRGAGDTLLPTLANLVAFYALGLPLGAVLAGPLGWGAVGVWLGLTVGLATVAVLLVLRIRVVAGRGGLRRHVG
ncbi:MAG: MATE family efflux transporter [Alphaproteobacteria bacterium]|nr:MATE family efflux transporter [Alphaproteobacteria bacterium]